jgi:hypothetical protein
MMFFNFLILFYFENKFKNMKTFRNTMIVLLVIMSIHWTYGYYYTHKKSELILINSGGCELQLFKDNSFSLSVSDHHGSFNYSGSYSYKEDKLIINDSLIEKKSDNWITTTYKYNKSNNQFEPLNYKFENLIQSTN